MGKKDPRVDDYIAGAAGFARPILSHLRKIVHAGCPDVEETIKWSAPHFDYKGMMCGMAAFKSHCTFGFWKESLVFGGKSPTGRPVEEAMGQFGRITAITDLPGERTMIGYVRKAAALNEKGIKVPSRSRPRKTARELPVPDDFLKALRKNPAARKAFEGFSPSHRNEYVEWVTEARADETRQRRLETALAWMAEGKVRNWKYVRK